MKPTLALSELMLFTLELKHQCAYLLYCVIGVLTEEQLNTIRLIKQWTGFVL